MNDDSNNVDKGNLKGSIKINGHDLSMEDIHMNKRVHIGPTNRLKNVMRHHTYHQKTGFTTLVVDRWKEK